MNTATALFYLMVVFNSSVTFAPQPMNYTTCKSARSIISYNSTSFGEKMDIGAACLPANDAGAEMLDKLNNDNN